MKMDKGGNSLGLALSIILCLTILATYLYYVIGWTFRGLINATTIGILFAYVLISILSLIGLALIGTICIIIMILGFDW